MGKGMSELDAATRDPRVIAAAQRESRIRGERFARLFYAPLARIDQAGQDQRLGAAAAFGKAALEEQKIGALTPHGALQLSVATDEHVTGQRTQSFGAWRERCEMRHCLIDKVPGMFA